MTFAFAFAFEPIDNVGIGRTLTPTFGLRWRKRVMPELPLRARLGKGLSLFSREGDKAAPFQFALWPKGCAN